MDGARADLPGNSSEEFLTQPFFLLKSNLFFGDTMLRRPPRIALVPAWTLNSGTVGLVRRSCSAHNQAQTALIGVEFGKLSGVMSGSRYAMGLFRSFSCLPQLITALVTCLSGTCLVGTARGDDPSPPESLVVRLVHPERQLEQLLSLFDGERAAHPAAALAAWKRANPSRHSLGKPVEAIIASLNPEMVSEWQVLDAAELRIDLSAGDGPARWFAIVPHDDGTLAAAITAQRVTEGVDEPPLDFLGRPLPVRSLGVGRTIFATQWDRRAVFAGSRAALERGLAVAEAEPRGEAAEKRRAASATSDPKNAPESGVIVDVEAARWAEGVGDLRRRRATAFLHGLRCDTIHATFEITGDDWAIDIATRLLCAKPAQPAQTMTKRAIDPSWLKWVPLDGAGALVSVACDPDPVFWDWAFALADRVDRADPAHAAAAPLRARLNLLAAAMGVRPEVDLFPHLNGITASLLASNSGTERFGGGIGILHIDDEASAERIALDVIPRLAIRLTGQKALLDPKTSGTMDAPLQLGTLRGRPLYVFRHGREVVIGWSDGAITALRRAWASPDRSAAHLMDQCLRDGKGPRQRFGALWPERTLAMLPGWEGVRRQAPSAGNTLPLLWSGWSALDRAADSLRLGQLHKRVHDLLVSLPLELSSQN